MAGGSLARHGRQTFFRALQRRTLCLSSSTCSSGKRGVPELLSSVSDSSLFRALSGISSALTQLQEAGLLMEPDGAVAEQRRSFSALSGRPSRKAASVPAEPSNGASELLKSVMGFPSLEEERANKPSFSFSEANFSRQRAFSASEVAASIVSDTVHSSSSACASADPEGDRFVKWLSSLQIELSSTPPTEVTNTMRKTFRTAIEKFVGDRETVEQARALYINSNVFRLASERFYKSFRKYGTASRKAVAFVLDAVAKGPQEEQKALFQLFAEFTWFGFENEIRSYQHLVEKSDMRRPHTWYPVARSMHRKIVYHHGPTNSGKTYSALQAFKAARVGVYCGPLRLLAVEVFKRMTDEGVRCNLTTGQERQTVPGATHVACTVEMADWTQQWDVAVIDEVQMLNDPDRGWAWTQALLALPATEVHLCGDSSALDLVRNLCADTGDELEEREYQRFTPLTVEDKRLKGHDFRNVEEGDCIVVFSRGNIYHVKALIEAAKPGWKCAVIYGALPQETRWDQAMLFNNRTSEYKVLVATDAIGMGLNLHIRRVVFSTIKKYNGVAKVTLEPPLLKQIAGRAGRRNSPFERGLVTAQKELDLRFIRKCMAMDTVPVTKAGLFPTFDKLEMFASRLTDVSFSELLRLFAEHHNVDGTYFLCNVDRIREVAEMLEEFPELTLKDRFHFVLAPLAKNEFMWASLRNYARMYSKGKLVPLGVPEPESVIRMTVYGAVDPDAYAELESHYQAVTLYQWLANYFPEHFVETVEAQTLGVRIARVLSNALDEKLGPPHDEQEEYNEEDDEDENYEAEDLKDSNVLLYKPFPEEVASKS